MIDVAAIGLSVFIFWAGFRIHDHAYLWIAERRSR